VASGTNAEEIGLRTGIPTRTVISRFCPVVALSQCFCTVARKLSLALPEGL